MIKILNLFNSLKKSTYFRNLTTLTIGATLAQLIGVLVAPILSRVYTPDDYGIYAIFAAVVTILSTIYSLRYESKIMLPKNQDEVTSLMLIIFYSTSILGGITFLASYLPSNLLLKKIGILKLGFWLRFTILASICTAIINSFYFFLTKNNKMNYISYTRFLISATTSTFAIIFGFLKINGGLIVSQIISLLAGLILIIVFSKMKVTKNINNKINLLSIAKKHRGAPIYLLPSSLIDVFSYQLQVFLIALWFQTSDVGNLRMSWTILALPSSFIGSAIGILFFQKFSEIWPDVATAKIFLFKTWRNLFFIGLVPTLLIILFGKELFVLFLGQKWEQGGEIASLLAPMFFVSFISSPTSNTYVTLGIEKIGFYLNLLVLFSRPLSLYIGMINNDLLLGLRIFVLSEVFNIILYQSIVLYHIGKVKTENICL